MNANELKSHLDNREFPVCNKSDIGYVTLPLLMLSQRLLTKIGELLDEKYNLSNSELDVMASLRSSGDKEYKLTPTKLYENLFFSSGGMTKILKRLEKKGYVRRLDNKEDKRSKLVQLTSNGIEILDISLTDVIKLEEEIFAQVNTDERKNLSDLLFKALQGVEQ